MSAAEKGGTNSPALIVAGDFYLARNFYDQLKCLMPGVVLLPARDDTLVYRDALSGENVINRLKSLYAVASGKASAVVASAEALMQIYPDRTEFLARCAVVEKGGQL